MSIVTMIVLLAIGFFMGVVTCLVIRVLIFESRYDGELHIDQTNPDRDLYQMQFTTPLEELPKRKKARLKILTKTNEFNFDKDKQIERLINELDDSQKLQRS